MPTKKSQPAKPPPKKEEPWETLIRLMSPPITPGKAAGWGLFLMLFGGPTAEAGNLLNVSSMALTGSICLAFGAISLIVGVLRGLGMIDPKKDFK